MPPGWRAFQGETMKQHILAAVLLVAAMIFYSMGNKVGLLCIAAAVACELWFWVGLFEAEAKAKAEAETASKSTMPAN
jgi:hypothetical protein